MLEDNYSMKKERQLLLEVLLPRYAYWACHEYGQYLGKSPHAIRRETVAAYVKKLVEGSVMPETKNYKPMSYRSGLKLASFLLHVPEDTALDLGAYCAETGVTKEAIVTLALDQFLRAHGANRTPVLETATE